MSSIPLSLIFILVSIALFIVMCYKGLSPIVASFVCTAIVSIASVNGFANAFLIHLQLRQQVLCVI